MVCVGTKGTSGTYGSVKLIVLFLLLSFMENLQTEVLEMEFQQFAKGGDTISEMDFAKILLRYTHLDTNL